MKSIHWILGGLIGMAAVTTALAQSTNKPAATKPKAKAKATNASEFSKDVVLDTPMQAKVKNESLNVRDRADLSADVVTKISRGEMVTVFEQYTVAKPKAGEPASWSRISLPTNAAAWVFAEYVDAKTMKTTRKLNVRGGPGENFKSLVLLDKGAEVTEVKKGSGWIQIVPPANAFGFVASEYLTILPTLAAPVAAPPTAIQPTMPAVTEPVTPPAQPINSTPVTEVAVPATAPTVMPAQAAVPVAPPPTATAITPPAATVAEVTPTPAPIIPIEDGKPRIVTREGYVHKALNIQAPTDYELMDVHSGDLIEYLDPNEKIFKKHIGIHVVVTGPEMLDSRWPKTPVLKVESLELIP